MSQTIPHPTPLTTHQSVRLFAIGVALWFLAAVILRTVGPMGALDGIWRAVTYALIIPGTVPFIFLTKWLARLRADQLVTGIALVTAAALICDGVAFGWFPALYGAADSLIISSAGAVFWGAGVGIFLAFLFNKDTDQ